MHSYANDLQLYIYCPAHLANLAAQRIIDCIQFTDNWMSSRLKNPGKTQFTSLGTRQQLHKLELWLVVQPDGTLVEIFRVVYDLGVTIDSQLSKESHANAILRSYFSQYCLLYSFHSSLTKEATSTLIHAFMTTVTLFNMVPAPKLEPHFNQY